MAVILEIISLAHSFGQVVVADGLNIRIERGQRVGIVGPNGAGKTSLLNMITGYIKPHRGKILFQGTEITGRPPRSITRLGIARSFQIPQLYTKLTVQENLLIALAARSRHEFEFWRPLRCPARLAESAAILERLGLQDYVSQPVVTLPEGDRKLLDVAMSLALRPALLLMDEPTSGVSMQDKFKVMDTLVEALQQSGVTTLFVEHDMEVVARYANRMIVLNNGHVEADGEPGLLLNDTRVRQAMGWQDARP